MRIIKILPIIVIYNEDFHKCNCYNSFIKSYANHRILLYENSPEPINKKYESNLVLYYHNKNNGGVSTAYNYGAKIAFDNKYANYILLLDQDTIFSPNYIDILTENIIRNPDIYLFVPTIIYNDNKPFSPAIISRYKTIGVKLNAGIYSLNKYLPVNSGACIETNMFQQNFGYNEKIKLDFADFDFFNRLKKHTDKFCIINSTAYQSFSNEEIDLCKLENRFKFYIEGANNTIFKRKFTFQVIRHTLSLTLRTKNMFFIKYLIKNYL